ncbi:MAG: hypothetical protein U5K30_12810 [Acidimicrobiales bacterium]|nr:hypothetical protein [Acidimicrobiales bacterium]
MVVALVVCALVVVALVVAVLRLRAWIDELTRLLDDTRGERDQSRTDASQATARAEELVQERDDALERVNRARRDAAEVANRLRDETTARTETESELDKLRSELDDVRAELADSAAAAGAAVREPGADASYAEALWALLLRQVEHTWRVSIALGPDDTSPLADAADPFRAAVEIEVEAAREEGGAAVDLVWADGATSPGPAPAALALALLRELIARLGITAGRTQLTVSPGDEHIDVRVEAVDDGGAPMTVELPTSLEVEPGVARIG